VLIVSARQSLHRDTDLETAEIAHKLIKTRGISELKGAI
jgi:hypothetical protein